MTRGADWFGFHATIEPVHTAEALQAALADPQQRWYGLRRIAALAAAGALVAATWNPNLHPRGKDGKFIEKFGWVRWFDAKDLKWHTGWVSDINGTNGEITVRAGDDKIEFPNAKNLYARPKPKALLDLPDPTTGKLPDKFKKVGGQGGSNPGGLYQIDGSFADGSPDIAKNSRMFQTIVTFRQPGTTNKFGNNFDPTAPAETFVPNEIDVIMVPRVDGTANRYDVLQRSGGKWYRVPSSGNMTDPQLDYTMRAELEVSPADAFGQPGDLRRHAVMTDLGTVGFTRGAAYDADDIAKIVQQTGSPLPNAGDQFYVKKMNIPERARSEALANDLYELLGIPVPDVAVGADGTTISSKIVPGPLYAFDANNPAHVAAAQEGFVADAWLSNWDVVGLSFDNIKIDADGRAWRIDAGGSLEYRAQGKHKGAMFGDNVGELDSLQNKSLNPTAAKVFGGVTGDQMAAQAALLQSVSANDIQTLADNNGMSHVGPILIARRKSILDQLGIIDPPPSVFPTAAELMTPKTVYNPVEAVQQMGAPPTVAVHNYNLTYEALPAIKVESTDWGDFANNLGNVVWKKDGDLWTYHSGLEDMGDGTHRARLRNVFTDEVKPAFLYDGEDEWLTTYEADQTDLIVDQMGPGRDLAIAEIVARTTNTPLGDLDWTNVNQDDDPTSMLYGTTGIGNWLNLQTQWERGRLGRPVGTEGGTEWPLYNVDDNSLWEITAFSGDGIKLRARDGSGDETTITQSDFAGSGPWAGPNNDTTAAIWKSKYVEDVPAPNVEANLDAESKLVAKEQGDDVDILAMLNLGPDGGLNLPDDDGAGTGIEGDPAKTIVYSADEDDYIYIPTAKLDEWIAGTWKPDDDKAGTTDFAQQQAAAQPSISKKITANVVDGLGPGEPLLSTEMAVGDLAEIEAKWLNKNVVVLPIEAHDNPDWEALNLGTANGTGTVTEVSSYQAWNYTTKGWEQRVRLKVTKPYGKFSWVEGGDGAKFKKVVIPIDAAPSAQQVTLKQNGDIFVNGEKVGTYDNYHYTGVIDADHSVAGKPMHFSAGTKTNLRNAASSLVVPIQPKPTKPKSAKVQATEAEIKDLNQKLAITEENILLTELKLEELAKATPVGEGNPLNDGSLPVKGDWVFSVKDGSYAQVLNPNVVGFAGKGVLSPDMIKVKIQDPATGKWKQSNRKRDQLVSIAAPGDTPFVLQTKALKTQDGNWFGPGTAVQIDGETGLSNMVLDTTTDGQVKYVNGWGVQHWTTSAQVMSVTSTGPTLKTPAGSADADALNAELAALNDEKAKLAATIATTTVAKPKAKKPVGTPYPGPGGATIKQPKWLAESREAKGLKNTKDGFVPTPGMILRHNDGTQYAVVSMGTEWSSHKNSVEVVPIGGASWDYKWRAVSTMVVDHDAMLTNSAGDPIPIISTIEGADWAPESGMVLSKTFEKGWHAPDPLTGLIIWRKKEITRYYVVAYDGTVYNADGTKASPYAVQPGQPIERIGYLDKSAPGGKKLTISVQQHHQAQIGEIEYAVIHDADEPAGIPLAQQVAPVSPPAAPTSPVVAPAPSTFQGLKPGDTINTSAGETWSVINTDTGPGGETTGVLVEDSSGQFWMSEQQLGTYTVNAPAPEAPTPEAEATPSTPEAPAAPNLPPTVSPTPVDELPVFTGKDPTTSEMPHPSTTKSSAGVAVPQVSAAPATLDVAAVAGTHSVTGAITATLDQVKANKASGKKDWTGTYALADHDVIEDMSVQTQTVRDAQGGYFVEVRFRLEHDAARKNHSSFITSTTNEAGDWEPAGRNAKNLVPGDLTSVRIASGSGATVKGALRPNGGLKEGAKTPNATVIAAPVLIGKNKAGTFDVYRTQVMTANGDIGYIDVEDRSLAEPESLYVYTWDPTKPRTSSGSKDLNPNAKDDGWTVKSKDLSWDRASASGPLDQYGDGSKKTGEAGKIHVGAGWTLQRDYQGAHIEYRTSEQKNSLDGQVFIRVPADDPDVHQKIADAMEAVGVSKEAQKPPDRDALIKMATDKVWEQFTKTWTKGKKPNSPQDALDAIDAAVGAKLGRKATMDDISVRVDPDGRYQVLVSEDVSKAIVATNGIKRYTHRIASGGFESTVLGGLSGENPGLLSTTERWQHGLFYKGMSSEADHANDAAGFVFMRMSTASTTGSGHVVIDPVVVHRQLDYYWRPHDTFGVRQSDNLNWLNPGSPGGSNEMMLQRRVDTSQWSYVVVSEPQRSQWIKKLHSQGIFAAPNGAKLEDFLVEHGGKLPPTPTFGDETPLSSLVANTTAAPALVSV